MAVKFLLSKAKAGQQLRVITINTRDRTQLRKLSAFGLLPGIEIVVLQTYPVVVLQIGNSQLAIDNETALCIDVSSRAK